MPPDQDRIRMQHMLDACREAMHFAEGRTRKDLDDDRMLSFALIRAIEVTGEAAGKVTAESRELLPKTSVAEHRRHEKPTDSCLL